MATSLLYTLSKLLLLMALVLFARHVKQVKARREKALNQMRAAGLEQTAYAYAVGDYKYVLNAIQGNPREYIREALSEDWIQEEQRRLGRS